METNQQQGEQEAAPMSNEQLLTIIGLLAGTNLRLFIAGKMTEKEYIRELLLITTQLFPGPEALRLACIEISSRYLDTLKEETPS